MKRMRWSLLTLVVMNLEAVEVNDIFGKAKVAGELRVGSVQVEESSGDKTSTLAMGGKLGIKTNPLAGISATATFYTTNALFGKSEETMFLSSDSKSYSIIGEAYLQAEFGKSSVKVGRQIVDTPYADSDDIGMVPNTFEGVTVVNQDITDTTVILASLNKWAGVDSDRAEKFNAIQLSGDVVWTAGAIYEGLENATFQAWHYKLDDANFNYLEAGYENEQFTVALQYTDQDNSNRAYGATAGVNFGDLALTTAYNRVDGEVSNGFGGGPFFTSSEDHTIAEVFDQEAVLLGAEYSVNEALTLRATHVALDKGENETDYVVSYAFNDKMSFDLIYSDMNNNGKMTRFFANYNF